MPVILNFFNTRDLYSETDRDVFQIVRSSENHKKKLKDNYLFIISVEKKNVFHIKPNVPGFCAFDIRFWDFFEKRQDFCS